MREELARNPPGPPERAGERCRSLAARGRRRQGGGGGGAKPDPEHHPADALQDLEVGNRALHEGSLEVRGRRLRVRVNEVLEGVGLEERRDAVEAVGDRH